MRNWRGKSFQLLSQVENFKFIEKLHILNTEFRGSYFENNIYQMVV